MKASMLDKRYNYRLAKHKDKPVKEWKQEENVIWKKVTNRNIQRSSLCAYKNNSKLFQIKFDRCSGRLLTKPLATSTKLRQSVSTLCD